MSKKERLRRKAAEVDRGKLSAFIGAILIVAALCGLFYFVYHRQASNPDYEGTIVDRWADYAESEQGSTPRLRLLVESEDHKRFTVRVDPHVYESARVGMKIKSRDGQVVLIEPNSNPMSGK